MLFRTISDLRNHLNSVKNKAGSIGFVPTMGALHPGHYSLVERSRRENQVTVASIFVNPLQFNDKKDLEQYPRSLESDLKGLDAAGCDIVFAPEVNEMYPPGRNPDEENLNLDLGPLDTVMEGAHRPGHFKGVCVVVKKLFDIVQPDRAYFGEKDYQQMAVIRHLVKALKIPVEVIACPTLREADGLAMSSRNQLLDPAMRKSAPAIYARLQEARAKSATEKNVQHLKTWMETEINKDRNLMLEYFEIVNAATLEPVKVLDGSVPLRACIAVRAGAIRLIDNIGF